MMKFSNLLLALSWLFWTLPAFGGIGENIARGKRYTLYPKPNYRYCTDPDDAIQLTDGIYTKGYFWTQKSTVGWQNAHPVIITIDLRVIQKAEPDVVIWEDPTWREPWKGTREMFELCDVLCPNMVMWINGGKRFAEFYLKQRESGKKLWFYACSGPGKLLDPYSYHRMEPWFCWRYGAEGAGYWAFGDSNGASSWNEYLSRIGAYTPLFLDESSVTAGKHMEVIREGVEDYEYLRMLRDRIAELERSGVRAEELDLARKLLKSAAERVTSCMTNSNMIYWKEPKDRSVADRVRIEILEMLLQLRSH